MPCLSGEGYSEGEGARAEAQQQAAIVKAIAAGVIAADNAYRLYENYKAQRKIARRANVIKEDYQNFLIGNFWPKEENYLNEFANPDTHGEAPEDVEVMGSRYAGRLIPMIAKKFADEIAAAKCNFARYCTSANKKILQDLMLARSNALASARVAGRQMAFKEWRAKIDQNYKRRIAAVTVGDGMIAEAGELYQAALGAYRVAGADLETQFNSALGSLGGAIGQYRSANTREASLTAMRQDVNNRTVYAPSAFGVDNTWDQMTGGGSNTFGGYSIGLSSNGLNSYSGLSGVYSSNGEAMLNGGQIFNQLDLARSGSYTYEVASIIPGTVTVNMGDFQLKDYAVNDQGDQPQ
jgi:hypothetical protein